MSRIVLLLIFCFLTIEPVLASGYTGGGSSGTVSSVGISGPSDVTWSGSPVTTTGTLSATRANQNANVVLAGPSSGGAAAPSYRALVTADLPLFTSTDQTITAAGALTLAHGLGYTPKEFWIALVCQSAEHNWSVNDVVYVGLSTPQASYGTGAAVYADGTNVYVRYGLYTNTFYVLDKTTGERAAITNTNWKCRFYAST